MRILRLAYEWPPPWDGLAPAIYEITKAQEKLGNEVVVFSSQNFPRALKRFSVFLTTAPAILLGYLFRRFRRRVDLVHGHGHVTACFNLYRLLFGRLDMTPYVLHLHVTAAGREAKAQEKGSVLDFWTKHFEWPLHKFSDRLGCRVADAVICTSVRVRKEALEYYRADPQKVFVVENGVNTRRFAPRRSQTSNLRSQVLYVGALTKRKNSHLLVEALRFLPKDYRLTIVGRGDEEYQRNLRNLVEKYNLHDRVDLVGYVEYPKLPRYYQDADILVLPSSYEGLPKVVLEALACGTPVLASGFRIQGEICGLHFLERLNAAALASRIEEVVSADGEVGIKKIRQRYDWSVKAREIQEIYEGIVSC
jgi:glycosyltransferase involved in cell wall biosynthesis